MILDVLHPARGIMQINSKAITIEKLTIAHILLV
jgi:hypothetical protein